MAITSVDLSENHVKCFETQFPTIESRYDAAVQLASNNDVPPEEEHLSRNFMTSHWGDEPEELRALGTYLFHLKNDVDAHIGGPVMVIQKGSVEHIFADDELEHDISYTQGVITKPELILGFNGNLAKGKRAPTRMGIHPPYLGFGIRLELLDTNSVAVDILGEVETTPVQEEPKLVPIYIGAVTLEDLDAYRNGVVDYRRSDGGMIGGRQVVQRELIFGREACAQAVESLNQKAERLQAERSIT